MVLRDLDNQCFGWLRKRKSLTNFIWGCIILFSAYMVVRKAIDARDSFWRGIFNIGKKHPNFENHYAFNAFAVILRRADDMGNYMLMLIVDFVGYWPAWISFLVIVVVPATIATAVMMFSGNSDPQSLRSQVERAIRGR